jgi:hypothetical protein
MGADLRDIYDPEFDGPRSLAFKKAPITRATWLLAGVALMSLVWAGVAVYLFLRAERSTRPPDHPLNDAAPPDSMARPSTLRPLFADTPASLRSKGLPDSQVSLAADVRAAEERGGEALWRSHRATGVLPTTSQKSASDSLKLHVQPGRKIDGWLMKVGWSILRDRGGSSRYNYSGVPPVYELSLIFPESLAGYEVWLWGHNYDFPSKEFTCPNEKFEAIKHGDWVRVFGVLRPGSRIEWEPTKADELLSLGEMTISDIQRMEVDPE